MNHKFQRIGLIARQRSDEEIESLKLLCEFLSEQGCELTIEEDTATFINEQRYAVATKEKFSKNLDLIIVVGGDGSLLNAAHLAVDHAVPVLGINRGRLGFLTDIHPSEAIAAVKKILTGAYFKEERFLLNVEIRHNSKAIHHTMALNEVVLMPGKYAHMLEFEIYINKQLLCSQRADGQIIATPTGSTAYALASGGPILHPALDAIVLVPMLPQSLSSRPIVVNGNSVIEIVIIPKLETSPQISCDGQTRVAITPGDTLYVSKKTKPLILLHPKNYDYFDTLRKKLLWEKKIT